MKDDILKDLEIYYAIKILSGEIKIECPKDDDILGMYEVNDRLEIKVKTYEQRNT